MALPVGTQPQHGCGARPLSVIKPHTIFAQSAHFSQLSIAVFISPDKSSMFQTPGQCLRPAAHCSGENPSAASACTLPGTEWLPRAQRSTGHPSTDPRSRPCQHRRPRHGCTGWGAAGCRPAAYPGGHRHRALCAVGVKKPAAPRTRDQRLLMDFVLV